MSALVCPKCGGDNLYSVEALLAHYPVKDDGSGGWDYTGGESKTFDETAEHRNLWCDDCSEDIDTEAGEPGQDTTSFSPGEDHTYLVGFPVVVTVHADGSISLEICAEDIVEAIADDDNEESDLDSQVADSAIAGAAYSANNIRSITVNTPKGA